MKKACRSAISGMLTATLLFSTSVSAIEDFSEEAARSAGGFVGLGVRSGPDYEGSDDYEMSVAPFGHYNWASGRYLSLGGTSGTEQAARLKANIIAKDQSSVWEFGPLLQYRMKRDDVDNSKVDKLKEIDAATEAGAFVGVTTGNLSFDMAYAADVSSEHDGQLFYLNSKYKLLVNDKFSMFVGAHLTWADDDYMDTYFGVSGGEAAKSGLSKYSASSGFKDAGISLTGIYDINDTWGIAANVGFTRMLNDAEDSPLVDSVGDENQFEAVVAVIYSF